MIGRLMAAGLLVTNREMAAHREPIDVPDALWVGELEPRVLELLPALLLKKPSLFVDPANLPEDLARVIRALRQGVDPGAFRGVAGADLAKWVPLVGHRGKRPSRLKSFRFTPDDVRLLGDLSGKLKASETDVIRQALRSLSGRLDAEASAAKGPAVVRGPHLR